MPKKKTKRKFWRTAATIPLLVLTNTTNENGMVNTVGKAILNKVNENKSIETTVSTKKKSNLYRAGRYTHVSKNNPASSLSIFKQILQYFTDKISRIENQIKQFFNSQNKTKQIRVLLLFSAILLAFIYCVRKYKLRKQTERKRKFDEEKINEVEHYDVCIIGGGPAGATAAYYLGKGGLKVLLIEKQSYPHDTICGDVISPPCFSVLQEMGVLQELLQEGIGKWCTARGLKSPAGNSFITEQSDFQDIIVQRIMFDHRMIRAAQGENVKVLCAQVENLGFDESTKYWNISCISEEQKVSKIVEKAINHSGSNFNQIKENCSVDNNNNLNMSKNSSIENNNDDDDDDDNNNNKNYSNLKQSSDSINNNTTMLKSSNDSHNNSNNNINNQTKKEFKVFARMVIAADGAESKTARSQGLIDTDCNTYFSRSFAKPFTHQFRADYAVFHPPHLLPGFFIITHELEDYLSLCCYIIPGGTADPSKLALIHTDIVQNNPHIKEVLGDAVQLTPIQIAPVRIGGVKKIYKNQFLVVGGAAGHVDPLTGEGIHFAIIGGRLAAKTILEGFAAGDLTDQFLSKFQKRINRSFGWDNYIASWVSDVLYRFPLIIDAVTAMIQRNSDELPQLWLSVRSGKRTKFLFLRPDIIAMLFVELGYQWFNTKYKKLFPKSEQYNEDQDINGPSAPILVRQRVRRARRQSLISDIPA